MERLTAFPLTSGEDLLPDGEGESRALAVADNPDIRKNSASAKVDSNLFRLVFAG